MTRIVVRAVKCSDVKKPLTEHHHLYGDIPLVACRFTAADGKEYSWTEHDRNYKPPMPKGAVRGDPTRQHYCHDYPKYFYIDEQKTCVQCRQPFVFSAKEQKFWYETLQFNFGSTAIRCRNCRKRRQSEHALREQIGTVLKELTTRPNDPGLLLDLARATVQYRELTGEGNLDRAIAAARKAADQWPDAAEPSFWEGKSQHLAGRANKARECLTRFLEKSPHGQRLAKLVAEAEEMLNPSVRDTAPAPSGKRRRRDSSR